MTNTWTKANLKNFRPISCRIEVLAVKMVQSFLVTQIKSDELEDKSVEQLVNFLIHALPPIAADFFGIKVRKVNIGKTEKKKLVLDLKVKLLAVQKIEANKATI